MTRQVSSASSHHGGSEATDQKRGLTVIAMLAVFTLVEYIFAVVLDAPAALVVILAAIAVVKAWLIVMYFMHLPLVWQGEEA
ncbi:MAG: cytochrome C oxidase subunit IV family protein [Dehalococcoidia bacterium]|nr:cytochrome C oxidase subunit IV family protein [Dehalococcoidia bacterium]